MVRIASAIWHMLADNYWCNGICTPYVTTGQPLLICLYGSLTCVYRNGRDACPRTVSHTHTHFYSVILGHVVRQNAFSALLPHNDLPVWIGRTFMECDEQCFHNNNRHTTIQVRTRPTTRIAPNDTSASTLQLQTANRRTQLLSTSIYTITNGHISNNYYRLQ